VLNTCSAVCKLFVGEGSADAIAASPLMEYTIVQIVFSALSFLGIFATTGAAVSAIGAGFLRQMRLFLLRKKDLAVITPLTANTLAFARECTSRHSSPLEEAIVSYASMLIRARMDGCGDCGRLEELLPHSPESYARQGVRRGSGTPDVFESEQMARGLREGINSRRGYRVSDLYSKNKHFMAE